MQKSISSRGDASIKKNIKIKSSDEFPSEDENGKPAATSNNARYQVPKKKKPRIRNRPRNKNYKSPEDQGTYIEVSVAIESNCSREIISFQEPTKQVADSIKKQYQEFSPLSTVSESCSTAITLLNPKMETEKSRDEIKAAREAKKLAKLSAKKGNVKQEPISTLKLNESSPAKLEKLGKSSALTNNQIIRSEDKSKEQILIENEGKNLIQKAAKPKSTISTINQIAKIESSIQEKPQITKMSIEDKFRQLKIVSNVDETKKKTTLTKAERRSIQEAQREAKSKGLAAKKTGSDATKKLQSVQKTSKTVENSVIDILEVSKKPTLTGPTEASPKHSVECDFLTSHENRVRLFNHLESYAAHQNEFLNNPNIHSAMARLGEQYATRTIVGSNARCIAFLNALKTVIKDYETPQKKEFARGLEACIKLCVNHLQKCRPLAVSVINAHKYIKCALTQLDSNLPETELKKHLVEFIDTYIRDQIEKAAQAISSSVQEKISDGDVILTFGCSSLIDHILQEAQRRKVDFRVIVIDSRPFEEGKELLRRLVAKGIPCTCLLINAVGFIMPEVTKVLLGAHALLANGYVMGRTGTAQIALLARSFNVPVLVCCETHKFSERVQTDAIVYNELGNPNDLITSKTDTRLENWHTFPRLYPLNLNFDITPPEFVTAVVTEVAILPCTSVPVILRIKPAEIVY